MHFPCGTERQTEARDYYIIDYFDHLLLVLLLCYGDGIGKLMPSP